MKNLIEFYADDPADLIGDLSDHGLSRVLFSDAMSITKLGEAHGATYTREDVIKAIYVVYARASRDAGYIQEIPTLEDLHVHLAAGSQICAAVGTPINAVISFGALPTFGGTTPSGDAVSWSEHEILRRSGDMTWRRVAR